MLSDTHPFPRILRERRRRWRRAAFVGAILLVVLAAAAPAMADIPVGTSPQAVAVNTATHKVYVANYGSNTVTVIGGAT